MSIRISHQGMFCDSGVPFALGTGLPVAVGQQASFAHYKKLATRDAIQGVVNLCDPGEVAVGVFVDVSPKGDTCTVETSGFEWVQCTITGVVIGGLVTPGAGGLLVKIAGATPTAAELLAGVWQVDDINGNEVLICVNTRL